MVRDVIYEASQPSTFSFALSVGNVTETIEVQAASVNTLHSRRGSESKQLQNAPQAAPVNVVNLQKRVAGVLPVAIDVPRAGTSFSFVRPLVLDEETKVTFNYKSR